MNNRSQRMQERSCPTAKSSACSESMVYDPLQMLPLAMGYIPWQQWKNVYEGCKGLEHGTIFEELIFPFQRASGTCGNGTCRQRTENSYRENSNRSMNKDCYRHTEERYGRERTDHCERRCD